MKGPERRKRIMGAASGAMIAEAVGEYMMHGALAKVEEKLNASGHAPTSQAYADLRTKLMSDELRQIKMFAQLAVAASAEAMRFDLNAAMFAANNALENNFSQVFLSLYAFGKAQADEVDDEADQQAYGKARKKAIDAVTPELVKKYGAKIADYAGNVIFGPDGYADEMIKVIKETTGLNDVSPEIRQMLKEAASTTLKGVGVALDAPGEGTEYILLKAGVDRATARNVHRAINDFMMVAGAAGLAKSAAQFGARTASSSSKAATRTSVDGRAYSNTVMGHKGKEIHTVAGTNKPAIIKGRFYSGHALDRMQTRGLTSSVVEDIIKNGNISQGNRANRICHYDVTNNITIVTEKGNVVTVRFGKAS
ncbi:MAG: DUF4258 domain-containing protein [Candidatus Paracaedibacteraceae bacterium]|nr:DUF4258 domain-containing protein [Candidatus Paracaedibacteraceae bacterium]